MQLTVGTSAIQAAPMNAARKTLSFSNRSTGGQVIHLMRTTVPGITTSNSDYVLSVGESLHFVEFFDGKDIKDSWYTIASGAGATLVIAETSERPGA